MLSENGVLRLGPPSSVAIAEYHTVAKRHVQSGGPSMSHRDSPSVHWQAAPAHSATIRESDSEPRLRLYYENTSGVRLPFAIRRTTGTAVCS